MARANDHLPDVDPSAIESREQAERAVAELREAVRHHDRRYHVEDDPVISDREYDRLFATLDELEQAWDLASDDSPTRRVGAAPREELATVRHPAPMLSLEAVDDEAALRAFDQRCRESLDVDRVDYVCEPKYDGLSVALIYEDGSLRTAATRGDGETGEDVTANLRTIRTVPLVLRDEDDPCPSRLVVRGEIYMAIGDFNQLNRRREDAGDRPFANPRNAAAGAVRQLDPGVTAERPLRAVVYEAPICEGCDLESHHDVLDALRRWGLPVDDRHQERADDAEAILAYHQRMEKGRDDLAFEIDGIVVKVDDLGARERLGARQRDPRWAVAYKFPPRRDVTQVADIVAQVGRTGTLTPVARLEPVRIGGVEVSRASLHNLAQIRKKDVRIGDAVEVERAGDVIPYVVRAVPERRDGSEEEFEMPRTCPACGGGVVVSDDLKNARCTNLNCPAQLEERIRHLASRAALDIEGLGEKRSHQLVEHGLVSWLPDVFTLDRDDLRELPGFAAKSADQLRREIDEARETTLVRFLVALGIPLVGEHVARVLARHHRDLDSLVDADEDDLAALDEIGPEIARSVHAFLATDENRRAIARMRESGLRARNDLFAPSGAEGPLDDLTFVFTGELERWTRDEVSRLVEDHGGRVSSSVSGNTDYVVAGPGGGQKLSQASEHDVPVLDEDGFVELLSRKGV